MYRMSIAAHKGGVGKTSTVVHLAGALAEPGVVSPQGLRGAGDRPGLPG